MNIIRHVADWCGVSSALRANLQAMCERRMRFRPLYVGWVFPRARRGLVHERLSTLIWVFAIVIAIVIAAFSDGFTLPPVCKYM